MDPSSASSAPARALPAADALTFLFTDVEESTALWERHETLMQSAMARHDALLDGIIGQHGGRRVKERGEGDSLFAVFARPADAVAAALAMAQAVLAEPWPAATPLRVRLGLHSGSAQLRAGDFYGPVVNRCARIRSLGHGNQVLLSATTAALVRDLLPAGASLRALGAHGLKGLSEPEEVFQLCHPALPADFPPLHSPQAPRHNLPQALTALIGRDAEQGEVLALLAAARLVTLVGSGGVGKTRLALAVAADLVDQYADGAWLVELAGLTEARLVPEAVAQTLGVREEPGRPLMQTLLAYLHDRRLLLVLDNCEHLVAACAALASTLLRACPGVRILATSREGLEVAGERRWRVPSLTVPDPAHLPPPELVGSYEAVRLFVARVCDRRADFALTAQNARAVAQVCARLDGIPLAIELAAARVPSLGAEGIAARLDDRFRLLTGGARDALPRQRTLRAALDWSYDLLGEPEQRLLTRLAVFAGGWTLPAAEAVCAGDGIANWEVLDLLDGLVNKSLVQAEERESGVLRYGLLETVRQYALERLAAGGEAEAVRRQHARFFLALAEQAQPEVEGAGQLAWLRRLEAEHDNLRAALEWALEQGEAETAVQLSGALQDFWILHSHWSEGRRALEAALAVGGMVPAASRLQALLAAADLAAMQTDYRQAQRLAEESLTVAHELGDRTATADALMHLGKVAHGHNDYARAHTLFAESLALYRDLGDRAGTRFALTMCGATARCMGDLGRALTCSQESLAIAREMNNTHDIAACLTEGGRVALDQGEAARAQALFADALALQQQIEDKNCSAHSLRGLGEVALVQVDAEAARRLLEQSLALYREIGARSGIAAVLSLLGRVALLEADTEQAAQLAAASLRIWRELGDRRGIASCLEGWAEVALAQGRPEQAARLCRAAAHLRDAIGAPLSPVACARYDQIVATARAHLDEAAFAAAWDEGRAVPLEQVIDEAFC